MTGTASDADMLAPLYINKEADICVVRRLVLSSL